MPVEVDKAPYADGDPVCYDEEGKWYFYDEVWSNLHGSYDTEQDAREGLKNYCRIEINGERDSKRKYWILFTHTWCPVCGREQKDIRERVYDRPKPKKVEDRHIVNEDYDWCDVGIH